MTKVKAKVKFLDKFDNSIIYFPGNVIEIDDDSRVKDMVNRGLVEIADAMATARAAKAAKEAAEAEATRTTNAAKAATNEKEVETSAGTEKGKIPDGAASLGEKEVETPE